MKWFARFLWYLRMCSMCCSVMLLIQYSGSLSASVGSSDSKSTKLSMAHSTGASLAEQENKIIYLTQKEYDGLVKRIDQLETAQSFNQKIINHLIQRMNHLEQIYISTHRHDRSQAQPSQLTQHRQNDSSNAVNSVHNSTNSVHSMNTMNAGNARGSNVVSNTSNPSSNNIPKLGESVLAR